LDESPYSLSLVIPAWNEEQTIGLAIQQASVSLSGLATEYEIIVVDDGSSDRTAEITRCAEATNPHVRIVQHPRNRGYGAALRTGFQAAKLDLVAFTDADCQFDLSNLRYMLSLTREYDLICGYRIDRQDTMRRRFYSWGYNTLVTLLLGSSVRDHDCALKIFHRNQLPAILPEAANYFANAEMLAKARLQGLSVVEVGVRHRPRAAGKSKVSVWEVPKTLSELLPFWWSRILFPNGSSPMAIPGSGWFWPFLIVLTLIAAVLLFGNLSYRLIEPDEARYAEIAREMLVTGDWIVPTLNHEPYLDKPPLFYWLVAASFKLFGTNECSARLVPASAAFLTVLVTYLFGRRMVGTRAAFLGAMTLTLSMCFVYCGRFLILDSLLSLTVTLALFAGYEALRTERIRWCWWLASAASCALGVLTKGPVAFVLLAPPLVTYFWLNRALAQPRAYHWIIYSGVVLAMTGPWYATLIAREPGFLPYFVWEHHIARYFLGRQHEAPIWFYLPVLWLGCLPWSMLVVPFARFMFSRSTSARALRPRTMGFFALWAGWCIFFFSLSCGKLPPYVLPALPALGILLGCYLENALFQTSIASFLNQARPKMPCSGAAVLCGTGIVCSFGAWLMDLKDPTDFAVDSSMCVLAGILLVVLGRRLPAVVSWALCCVLVFAVIYDSAQDFFPEWAYRNSVFTASGEVVDALSDKETAVACCGVEFGSIRFYLDRDSIGKFSSRPTRELLDFLAEHPRTLLITRPRNDMESMKLAMPNGVRITKLGNSRRAAFVLVQHPILRTAKEPVAAEPNEIVR
jgi:dolichol-phosphate mannosyltransferase